MFLSIPNTHHSTPNREPHPQPLSEWRGEKILDKLLEVMSENLRTQYDSGRLQGKEYADVYVEDNFGQKKELHFSFNDKSAEQHVDHPKPTPPTSKSERDA